MLFLEKFQKDIIKAATDFAKGEFDKHLALTYDKEGVYPKEVIKKAGDLGFIGMHIDEEYGGSNLSYFEVVLFLEALATVDSTFAIAIMNQLIGLDAVNLFASRDCKSDILPKIIDGDLIIGYCLDCLYDVRQNDLSHVNVTLTNDVLTLNGSLKNVINGVCSNKILFGLNRLHVDGEEGIGLFLLDVDIDGISIVPQENSLGWSMCKNAIVKFNNLKLRLSDLIGGKWLTKADLFRLWTSDMIFIAGICLGISNGAYMRAVQYVKQRIQFNKKIIEFPVSKIKLSDMITKIHISKLSVYYATKELSNIGSKYNIKKFKNIFKSVAISKLMSARLAKEISDEAIQLLGGYGYMREYMVERFYRDAKCCELIGGTNLMIKKLLFELENTLGGKL